jgi:hypothetical protein
VLPGISEHTKKIMEQPPEIAAAAAAPLERLKQLFKLEEVVSKKEKNTGESVFGRSVGSLQCGFFQFCFLPFLKKISAIFLFSLVCTTLQTYVQRKNQVAAFPCL